MRGKPFYAWCWFLCFLPHDIASGSKSLEGLEDAGNSTDVVLGPDGDLKGLAGLSFNLQAPSAEEEDKELSFLTKEEAAWKSPTEKHHSKRSISVDSLGRLAEVEESEEESYAARGMLRAEKKCADNGGTCACKGVVGRGVHGNAGTFLRVDGEIQCTSKLLGGSATAADGEECHCYSLGWCEGREGVIDPAHRRRTFKGREGVQMYQRRRWCGFGPRDCTWGQWGTWSKTCSGKCGTGQRIRRRLQDEAAVNGGKCEEPPKESKACKLPACPLVTKMRSALRKVLRQSHRRRGTLRRRRRRWLRRWRSGGTRRRRRRNAFTRAWARVWGRRRATRRRWLRRVGKMGNKLKKLKTLATKVFKQPSLHNPTMKGSKTATVETKAVPGWQCNGTKFVHSGNGAFGGIRSRYGNHFVDLAKKGASMKQTIKGHKKGRRYQIQLDVAKSPGQSAPIMAVKVDGKLVKAVVPDATRFKRHTVDYVAKSANVKIEVDNDSPKSNSSVLIDRISDKVRWTGKRGKYARRVRSAWSKVKRGLRRRGGHRRRRRRRSWLAKVRSWGRKARGKFNASKLGRRAASAWRRAWKGATSKARGRRGRLRNSRLGRRSQSAHRRRRRAYRRRAFRRRARGSSSKLKACYQGGYYYPWMKGQSSSKEASITGCQKRCATVATCTHFSFWEKSGKCYLTDKTAKFRRRSHSVFAGPPSGCSKEVDLKSKALSRRKRGMPRTRSKRRRGRLSRKRTRGRGVARRRRRRGRGRLSRKGGKGRKGRTTKKLSSRGRRRRRESKKISKALAKFGKGKNGKRSLRKKSSKRSRGGRRRRRSARRTKAKANLKSQSKAAPPVTLTNSDFEQGSTTGTYQYGKVPGWSSAKAVFIRSANGVWGGTRAASGKYFLGLQMNGAFIEQTVKGLVPGKKYHLESMVASRRGSTAVKLEILVGGKVIKTLAPTSNAFKRTSVSFTAKSASTTIRFKNASPRGDRTVFLDKIAIKPQATTSSSKLTAKAAPPVTVTNSDFEQGSTSGTYQYANVPGWSSRKAVFIRSANGVWGGTRAASGNYFLGLQMNGAFIEQTLKGLVPGKKYHVEFMVASRLGNKAVKLQILVGGRVVRTVSPRSNAFKRTSVSFTAKSASTKIRFKNSSPGGDRTVFLDKVAVKPQATSVKLGAKGASVAKAPPVTITNNDFEQGSTTTGYQYAKVPGWSSAKTVFIRSANGVWGGTKAASGKYFLGMQKAGAFIEQTVKGHVQGAKYTLELMVATRRGTPVGVLQILIDGTVMKTWMPKSTSFSKITVNYVAKTPSVKFTFKNVSPPGDRTVFLDKIAIKQAATSRTKARTTKARSTRAKRTAKAVSLKLTNSDFEQGSTTHTFHYNKVPGWSGRSTIFIRSANGAWGGTRASSGKYFLGLQGNGAFISQTVKGHVKGQKYYLKCMVAKRRGNPAAKIQIEAGGKVLKSLSPPSHTFSKVSVSYVATSPSMTIKFKNASPRGDLTVFVDKIAITGNSVGSLGASRRRRRRAGRRGTRRSRTSRRRRRRRKARRFFMAEGRDLSLLESNLTTSANGASLSLRIASNTSFVALPREGSILAKTVKGHVSGRTYHLRFRLGSPTGKRAPRVRVLVDNTELRKVKARPGEFHQVMVRYKATSPSMHVKFQNLGPGERGAYLDDITLESVWPKFKNRNFQQKAGFKTYEYMHPPHWKSKATVVIHSGNGAWNGTTSFVGEHFLGMEGSGGFVEQTVPTVPGHSYRLSFHAARRKGNAAARLRVRAGDKVLKTMVPKTSAFAKHSVEFTGKEKSTAIRFENVSPPGDYTVFLDHITMTEAGPAFS